LNKCEGVLEASCPAPWILVFF